MKLNDKVLGAALLVLGLVILWHVSGFPDMPGQKVGPAMFPALIASGFTVCGLMLIFSARGAAAGEPAISFGAWVKSPKHVARFAAVVGGLLFYILFSDALGFHLTGILLLTLLCVSLDLSYPKSLLTAAAATVVIHLAFYKLLGVPLPWGLLERFAW